MESVDVLVKQMLKVVLVIYFLFSRNSCKREIDCLYTIVGRCLSYEILYDEKNDEATTSINGICECQRNVTNVQFHAHEKPVVAILYQFYYSYSLVAIL